MGSRQISRRVHCGRQAGPASWSHSLHCRNSARFLKKEFGVDAGVMPADAEPQVWSRGAACRSFPAECLAPLDLLTYLNLDLGEVEIHADKAVAVVDKHCVALEEQFLGQNYCPARHCQDR